MELVYDNKTGTWGEAPEAYAVINCATKKDYEFAKRAIKTYKELEAKHWDECRQIAHYDDELKEAKRLLKAAVEDFELIAEAKRTPKGHPHPHMREYLRVIDVLDMRWRYADEAEKLLKED